jgi:protein-tyrosine kinase
MTLSARCETCEASQEVTADDLFDFDCRCDCGGVLVLEEDGDLEDDDRPTQPFEDYDDRTRQDDEPDLETRSYRGYDRPTKADTEEDDDPYALAAEALDPTATGRSKRTRAMSRGYTEELRHSDVGPLDPDVESDTQLRITSRSSRVPEPDDDPSDVVDVSGVLDGPTVPPEALAPASVDEEEDNDSPASTEARLRVSTDLRGTPAEADPLPSWDGGDTQFVKELANSHPTADAADFRALDAEADIPLIDDLEDLVEVVEITTSTSGRGSRTYDPDEILAKVAETEEPRTEEPRTAEPSPSVAPVLEPTGDVDAGDRPATLFPEDLDWLALIDDRLQEATTDSDESGRVFIRMPSELVPEEGKDLDAEQVLKLQATLENLESGEGGHSSLESLIMSTLSDERTAQRYDSQDDETKAELRGDALPDKANLHGPATANMSFGGGDEATQAQPRVDTAKWAAAFKSAKSDLDSTLADDEENDDGPTQSWGKATSESSGPDGATQNWPGANNDEPQTRAHPRTPTPEPSPARATAPSSRHNRRGEGERVIDRFHHDRLDPALICAREVGSPEADHFRQLYQQLFNSNNGSSPRSILVTSAHRGEGKTTIAANLAIVAARVPGRGVVLVDADPRGGGILRAFGERSQMEGLLEALETGAEPSKFVVQFSLGRLDVIPLGIVGSNAAELIASDMMADFLNSLRQLYPDWVIIVDGSSVLHSADPLALANAVDGVVLVVRAGQTPEDEVSRATELLDRKKILGVVLNDAPKV